MSNLSNIEKKRETCRETAKTKTQHVTYPRISSCKWPTSHVHVCCLNVVTKNGPKKCPATSPCRWRGLARCQVFSRNMSRKFLLDSPAKIEGLIVKNSNFTQWRMKIYLSAEGSAEGSQWPQNYHCLIGKMMIVHWIGWGCPRLTGEIHVTLSWFSISQSYPITSNY